MTEAEFNPEDVDTDAIYKDFQRMAAEASFQQIQQQHIITNLPETVSQVPGDEDRQHPASGVQVAAGGPNGAVLVPSLTAEETSRGISSNGKKMVPIKVPENLDAGEFRRALAAAYMEYIVEGSVTLDGIVTRSGLSVQRAGLIASAPEFRTALAVRGVVTTPNAGITPEQDYALQIILDTTDGLTFGRKLKKAGISNSTWQAWLKNPLIASHFQRATDQLFNDSRPGMLQVVAKAGEGDLAAIKFMWEVNGRHNPNQQATVDVAIIMNKIMELLAVNVEPNVLAKVAMGLREIGETAGLQSRTIVQ